MRQVNAEGIALIKRFEGFQEKPYKCPAGKWTIGYGHTHGVNATTSAIDETQADFYLRKDLEEVAGALSMLVKAPLGDSQFAALASFVFNIGATRFAKSTLLKKLNAKSYGGAAEEFPKWIYTGGTVLPGLVARRAAERTLFLKGA